MHAEPLFEDNHFRSHLSKPNKLLTEPVNQFSSVFSGLGTVQGFKCRFTIYCPLTFRTDQSPFSLSASQSWRAQLANAGTRCASRDQAQNPRVLESVLIMSPSHDYPEIYFWDRRTLRTDRDVALMKQEVQGSASLTENVQEINIRSYRTSHPHGANDSVLKSNRPWEIFSGV